MAGQGGRHLDHLQIGVEAGTGGGARGKLPARANQSVQWWSRPILVTPSRSSGAVQAAGLQAAKSGVHRGVTAQGNR